MKRIFKLYVVGDKIEFGEIISCELDEVIPYAKNFIEELNKNRVFLKIKSNEKFHLISELTDKYIEISSIDENADGTHLRIKELTIKELLDIISKEIGDLEDFKIESNKQILEKETKLNKLKELIP